MAAGVLLVRVRVCGWETAPTSTLEKVRAAGERVRSATPTPVRAAVMVLPVEATVRTPGRVPIVVGVKVTSISQVDS